MKAVTKFTNAFDRALNFLFILAGIMLGFAWLSVCLEVVTRYFLNRPQIWVIEISSYILAWVTFMGAAWVLKEDGHVSMDLVFNKLSPRMQTLLNIVTSGLCVVVWLVLTWYSAQLVWSAYEGRLITISRLELPRAPIYAILPLGSFLLFIQFVRRTYGYLLGWKALGQQGNASIDGVKADVSRQ